MILNVLYYIISAIFLAIGVVNTFWGNDMALGIGLIILSVLYLPPITSYVQNKLGIVPPHWLKLLGVLFVLWVCLGVGELFLKIQLMRSDLGF
jgi:hypothetical protein